MLSEVTIPVRQNGRPVLGREENKIRPLNAAAVYVDRYTVYFADK